MRGDEIRERFMTFFQQRDHVGVPSSSLVPQNDPTLLFTNAGMNQFKAVFLGEETRPYQRAVSSQKCVRAGGKHNDLENVGRTARHHTFFEMLGNFSFGDYFKREAIALAWAFVTEELKLPPERLLITVHAEDDDACDIWRREIGLPEEKVIRIDSSDNFWSMGATGPCGPCSEIFYDFGPGIPGGPPGSAAADGDRFVEIWNLVFMQYDRAEDGTMAPLPNPCIDTGAGLERLAAILQGKTNNYDSDLFQPLIEAATRLTGGAATPDRQVSLRVIADHIRSVGFLIADGVLPSNEGRGYVLRRIMRRAMRHGRLLGMEAPFLHQLVPVLVARMGGFFPELAAQEKSLAIVIENEEKRFATTLGSGLKILEEATAELQAGDRLDGETVFTLYDTYGFPVDLTADILSERKITLDLDGFTAHMAEQRRRARAAWSGSGDEKISGVYRAILEQHGGGEFLGYTTESAQGTVQAIIVDGETRERLDRETRAKSIGIVVNQTPFYGESGGQVGDSGLIEWSGGRFQVETGKRPLEGCIVHQGRLLEGALAVGETVTLTVDRQRRDAIRLHHSATHLLHHALGQVLGAHVKQAGSLVAAERMRFDFSHFQGLTAEELQRIEALVNDGILANDLQETVVMTPEEAVAAGAQALFGEKYGEQVRVVRIGASLELCGGTHVRRSGDIGLFRILSEGAVAAGVRRIEGVCGRAARESYSQDAERLRQAAQRLKTRPDEVIDGVERLQIRLRDLERELEKAKSARAGDVVGDLAAQVQTVGDIPVLAVRVEGVDPKGLRDLVDRLKDKLGSAVILVAMVEADKVSLVAGVTGDLTGRIKAGDLMRFAAERVGGKGGGRPDMAQGGGNQPEQLAEALATIPGWIKEKTA